MAATTTIRLKELAEVSGRTRDMVRNMQNQGNPPWDESGSERGKQRTFTGFHALCLVIAEVLTKQGLSVSFSSECAQMQARNIDAFLDEVDGGREPEACADRLVAGMLVLYEDRLLGERLWPFTQFGDGSVEAIEGAFGRYLRQIGREGQTIDGKKTARQLGGPQIAVASVAEAYRILVTRASKAGFAIHGRLITRIEGPQCAEATGDS